MKTNSHKIALIMIIVVSACAILLQFSVIFGIVDFKNVWGGRLPNRYAAVIAELIAIIINFFLAYLAICKARRNYAKISDRTLSIILKVASVVMVFNTFGNAISKSNFEKLFFTPLTLILAICYWVLATSEHSGLVVGSDKEGI